MQEGIHIALAAERLGEFLGFPITNTVLMSWVVMALLIGFALIFGRRLSLIPGRLQTLVESGFVFVSDYLHEIFEDAKLARRFLPLILTIFLFIFVANLIEFTPGIGSVGFFEGGEHGTFTPLLRSLNTDLNVALALAIISFFVTEITGILHLGFLKYGSKFVTFKSPIMFGVGLLEIIGNLARLISLSFRLFGNILAGEVLIGVLVFFVPYVVPLPFMLFELFIGFMQAAIFALLTLFFIKLSITEPHAEETH